MTRDNAGELAIVESFCKDFTDRGWVADDIVTLGGATGCRDPLVVSDVLAKAKQKPKKIFFNDLSPAMVGMAQKTHLTRYQEPPHTVTAIAGPIHEIAQHIPRMPRRVIIGVYRLWALLESSLIEGYAYSGLEGYVRNAERLGDCFILEPIRFEGTQYVPVSPPIELIAQADRKEYVEALRVVRLAVLDHLPDAIRVTGLFDNGSEPFLSHWFSEWGVRNLFGASFPAERIHLMSLVRCPKGFVLCLDPVSSPPKGIVTVLNNVLGNVLPHEHVDTLRAIDRLSS
ncbi:hypothetical protein A3H77_00350 [Candidatus Kaiserbacteria bacterium RIFCSPLOWO2_02_FULL_56_11]|nr:MAG: hypothetical protein A3E65_02760 [Candidatus Kaiserbacteria bacterium RIFCSPHIGHO2_12_FULL_56_13]OGG81031.1 MAG: hypothetical protein A3H77_00350 [Candidatus Kaiserbacteria bacterium RIFCSPLOWO2_02_FULL_56_11]